MFNAGRLQQFHRHCLNHFSAPALDEAIPYANNKEEVAHTRVGVVGESLFQALLISINNFADLNDQQKLMYQCYAILIYRCGLRPHEVLKLHLDDIGLSSDRWISITPNKFGSNKSPAANRKVPLIKLLVSKASEEQQEFISEYGVIKNLLRQRKTSSKNRNIPLFFSGHDSRVKLRQSNISRVIKRLLSKLSGDETFVTYHLRHSCISRMQCLFHCEQLKEVIHKGELKEILPYDYADCLSIKALLSTENKRDNYWAIASFSGHSSPVVTFNSYLHLSDLLVGYLINKRKDEYPVSLLQNLSCISNNKLATHFGKLPRVAIDKFSALFEPLLKRVIKKAPSVKQYKPIKLKPVNQKINIDTCYQVLNLYQNGTAVSDILSIYQIDLRLFEKWLSNAKYVAGRLTIKQNPRLNNKKRATNLLPTQLKSKAEKDYFERFIIRLKKQYTGNQKEEIKWAFSHFLTHHAVYHGVYFNNPDDLTRFTKAFKHCIALHSWQAQTQHIEHHANSNEWLNALEYISTKTFTESSTEGRGGHGGVYLKLKHPVKEEASPLVTYMLRMAIIMVGQVASPQAS